MQRLGRDRRSVCAVCSWMHAVDVTDAQLRPLDVAEDRDVLAGSVATRRMMSMSRTRPRACRARSSGGRRRRREVSRRWIDLLAAARRAEGGDDFGSAHQSHHDETLSSTAVTAKDPRVRAIVPDAGDSSPPRPTTRTRSGSRARRLQRSSQHPRDGVHSRTICANVSGRMACGPSDSASSGL